MTRRLILMRHAKSGWDDPTLDDHDRPLTKRGNGAAVAIGAWLKENGYLPDAVLSSTARRTVETWRGLAPSLGDPAVEFSSALYLASPGEIMMTLSGRKETCVLMLGHNPGTGALAAGLLDKRPHHADFMRYPSAATTVIDFDIDNWQAVRPGAGTCVDFVVPRELG